MRRFKLFRTRDVTGVSGIGHVAEGVEFTDGTVVMKWHANDRPGSIVHYASIEHLINIHDHKGTEHENTTEVVWIDIDKS
jgi:hypothetical protein